MMLLIAFALFAVLIVMWVAAPAAAHAHENTDRHPAATPAMDANAA